MQEEISKWIDGLVPWLLSHGIKILIIIAGAYFLNKLGRRIIKQIIKTAIISDKSPTRVSEQKRAETLIRIFSFTMKIIIITTLLLMLLQEIGVQIGPILAGLGIVGLAVGFGGQYLIRDVITGLFIILENQYRIGDVVNFDGTGGLVEDISLRMTTIRDLDGTVHHIPHGEIKKVANLTKYFARVNLNIGVSYGSNLEQVIKVINDTGTEMSNDPKWKDLIIQPPQFLRVDDFADSSIVVKILGETQPIKQWEVTGELRKRIKVAFDRAGIEIPFPQRVMHQGK